MLEGNFWHAMVQLSQWLSDYLGILLVHNPRITHYPIQTNDVPVEGQMSTKVINCFRSISKFRSYPQGLFRKFPVMFIICWGSKPPTFHISFSSKPATSCLYTTYFLDSHHGLSSCQISWVEPSHIVINQPSSISYIQGISRFSWLKPLSKLKYHQRGCRRPLLTFSACSTIYRKLEASGANSEKPAAFTRNIMG
jgi:hypothetical protein